MAKSKTSKITKIIFTAVSIAAIIYCVALLVFDKRLDYEIRHYLCRDDKVCQMKLWLEYKKK